MIFRNLAKRVAPTLRSLHTTNALQEHHPSTRGVFGSNVPFPVDNKYKLLFISCLFFGSGIGLPFLLLRYKIIAANEAN